MLWIAFIFVSLNYQKHQSDWAIFLASCCELLSFLYLWTIKSIPDKNSNRKFAVVNCFHFCIFELSKASAFHCDNRKPLLWIAFIFVSLNYQKHPTSRTETPKSCCELLSFLYLWTIKSIFLFFQNNGWQVVNCFHFCIFELSKASSTSKELYEK